MARENKNPDDNQSTLDDFFGPDDSASPTKTVDKPAKKKQDTKERTPVSTDEASVNDETSKEPEPDDYRSGSLNLPATNRSAGYREVPDNLEPSYLLSVDYEGGTKKKAIARLYNPTTKKLYFWYDNTGHKPFCYSELPPQVVEQKVRSNRGFSGTKTVELRDLLRDETRTMTKVFADDPLSIGGTQGAIRDLLSEKVGDQTLSHAWEAAIRYRNTYSYDNNLIFGLMYKIENGILIPVPPRLDKALLAEFEKIIKEDESLDRIIS
ncbi:MAG: hypothetical protein ACTSQZ_02310, partial [Candidatus Thorarchaeota archaeon]